MSNAFCMINQGSLVKYESRKKSCHYQTHFWVTNLDAKLWFSADEPPVIKYVQDLELAYIQQRYKEFHDNCHALMGYNTSFSEEIAIKWFEMIHTGLPVPTLIAFVN